MKLLKQSTGVTVRIGPFIDDTDFKTPKTGLTLTQGDILLWKVGGTTASQKNESTSCTHRESGYYTCPLDTTDTNTLGMLCMSVNETSALPVWHDFMVMPANVWDSLFGADALQVDVTQLNGSASTATNLEKSASTMVRFTVSSGSTTTSVTTSDLTEATNDHYKGRVVIFITGALAGQASDVTAYNGTTKALTVSTLTEAPANTDTAILV